MDSLHRADALSPVERVLRRARELRFLGPAPLELQIANGRAFGDAVIAAASETATVADLGPGGGVPSLVIADRCRAITLVLIERSQRRVDFLRWAVAELAWSDRITVHLGEAEDAARTPRLTGAFDVVTARSFGPAAVTAECACRLLRPGGCLIVSEPPDAAGDRWPDDGLRPLGLTHDAFIDDGATRLAVARRDPALAIDDGYPRRAGVARRRPLF